MSTPEDFDSDLDSELAFLHSAADTMKIIEQNQTLERTKKKKEENKKKGRDDESTQKLHIKLKKQKSKSKQKPIKSVKFQYLVLHVMYQYNNRFVDRKIKQIVTTTISGSKLMESKLDETLRVRAFMFHLNSNDELECEQLIDKIGQYLERWRDMVLDIFADQVKDLAQTISKLIISGNLASEIKNNGPLPWFPIFNLDPPDYICKS